MTVVREFVAHERTEIVTGVRLRADVGWEGRCNECCEWWPLDEEFWYPRQGVARCRGCINLAQRRAERRLRASEVDMVRLADRRRRLREWARRKRASSKAAA